MVTKKRGGPDMCTHIPTSWSVIPENQFGLHGEEQQYRCAANSDDRRQSFPICRILLEALSKARPSAQHFRFGFDVCVAWESWVVTHAQLSLGQKHQQETRGVKRHMGHNGKSNSLRSTERKPEYQRKGEQTGKLNWRQMDNGKKSRT